MLLYGFDPSYPQQNKKDHEQFIRPISKKSSLQKMKRKEKTNTPKRKK